MIAVRYHGFNRSGYYTGGCEVLPADGLAAWVRGKWAARWQRLDVFRLEGPGPVGAMVGGITTDLDGRRIWWSE